MNIYFGSGYASWTTDPDLGGRLIMNATGSESYLEILWSMKKNMLSNTYGTEVQ